MNAVMNYITSDLRRRLLVVLLPLVVLPIFILGTIAIIQLNNFVSTSVREAQNAELSREASRVEQFVQQLNDDVRFLATLPTTGALGQALVADDAQAAAQLQAELEATFFAFSESRTIYDQVRFLDAEGLEIVRVNYDDGAAAIVPQEGLQPKGDRSYFTETIRLGEGQIYVSPLNLNREGSDQAIEVVNGEVVPVVRYGMPVYVDGVRQPVGVIVTNVYAERLLQLVAPVQQESDTVSFILNNAGYFLYHSADPSLTFTFESGIQALDSLTYPRVADEAGRISAVLGEENGQLLRTGAVDVTDITADTNAGTVLVNYESVTPPGASSDYYWVVGNINTTAAITQAVQSTTAAGLVIALILMGLAIVAVNYFVGQIATPIRDVAQRAERTASGEVMQPIEGRVLQRRDEVGELSRSFNDMTVQLRQLVNELEARVQARTADLETSAEIASAANQIRTLEDLLSLTVNLIRDRFDFYYVQIYLIDENNEYAVLRDGTGYVGRQLLQRNWRLPLDGRSLVAEAIRTGSYSVVQDTSQDPNFLPNELLSETRAELTVPLRTSDQIIGALDIQHNEPNIFQEGTRQLFQTLADQLAVTFENLRLLESSERRAREMATVAEVSTEAASTLEINKLLRSVVRLTRDNFDLYHAHIYLLNEAGDTLTLAAGSGEAGYLMLEEGHSIPLQREHSLVARAARNRQAIISNDVQQEPDFLPNPLLPETRSEMAIPMLAGRTLIGVLDVQSEKLNRFDEEDVRVKSTLASQIAIAINNARQFEAVESARQEVDRIFSSSIDMLGSATFDGYFTNLNDAWMRTLGYTKEELLAAPFISFVHPDDVDSTTEAAIQLNQGVEVVQFANRYRAKDGSYRWISWNSASDRENGLIHFVARDITQEKEDEYEQRVLLNVSNAFNTAATADHLLRAILPHARRNGLTAANLFYIESDKEGQPQALIVASNWRRDDSISVTPVGTQFNVADFKAVQDWLAEDDTPTLYDDIETDTRLDNASRGVYQQFGTQASVILPLFQRGAWVGLYLLLWTEKQAFTEADERIYEAIMRQATPAVAATRAAEQTVVARMRAEILANINATLSQAIDEDMILEAIGAYTDGMNADSMNLSYFDLDEAGDPLIAMTVATRVDGEPNYDNPAVGTPIPISQYPLSHNWIQNPDDLFIVDDVATEPLMDDTSRQLMHQFNVATLVLLPLVSAGIWQGSISLQWAEPHPITEEDRYVLSRLIQPVASVVASRRAILQTERRAAELETVALVSAEASTNFDLDTMLKTVVDLTKEQFGLYHAHVYLLDEKRKRLVLAAGAAEAGNRMVRMQHGLPLAHEHSLVARAARENRGVIVNDVTLDPDHLPNPLLPETRAEMAIPIIAADKVIGVLDVQSDRVNRFHDEDVQIMTILALQLGIAIENARLFQQSNRRVAELQSVAHVSTSTAGKLAVDELLQSVADLTKQDFERYHAHVYLLDETSENLVLRAGAGEVGREMVSAGHRIPIAADSLVARCARTRDGVLIDDVQQVPDFLPNPLLPETRSEIAVPIMYGDQLLGVLDVQDNKPYQFTELELQVLSTLANQVAVAIQNARQFEVAELRLRDVQASARIAEFVRQSDNLEAMFQNILQVVLETLQPDNIVYSRYEAQYDQWYGVVGVGAGMSNEIARTITDPGPMYPHGLEALNTRQVVTVPNARRYPDFPSKYTDASSLGLKSVLVIPVVTSTEATGVVFLNYTSQYKSFTADETTLATSIANQITIGIERRQQQEQVLRQSTVVTTSKDFIGIATLDGFPVYINPAGLAMTGYTSMDDLPTGQTLMLWYDDVMSQLLADVAIPTAMREGSWRGETRLLHKNGSQIPVDQTIFPILDAAGNPVNVATICVDITERKKDEEEQATLYGLSSNINEALAEQDLVNAVQSAQIIPQASSIGLSLFENQNADEASYLEVVANWRHDGETLLGVALPLEQVPFIKRLDRFDVTTFYDIADDERIDHISLMTLQSLDVRSAAIVPLTIGQRWLGILTFYHENLYEYDERQRRMLRSMSRQVAASVERIQLARQTARRASELETVANVSAATTTLLQVKDLLKAVSDLTKERFNLYHAHIYLLDDENSQLVLAGGAGDAGDQMIQVGHRIPMHADSIVARAARTREGVIVNDTAQFIGYLPNPLLPDTRSEMAIPMTVGDELIGVLDVQSTRTNRFTSEDVRMKTTLADQVAVAVRNAQAFERERRTVERLREVDRLKQEFLANMSHELRTPLNSIIGYSEVLMDGVDGELTEDAIEDVDAIYTSGKHLLSIINEILDLAKIDAGQMELRRKEIVVRDFIDDIVRQNQVLVKDKPIELALVEHETVPSTYADPVRLKQIMLNLLGNAIKFTEEGAITLEYGMWNPEEIYITVRDTGPGMDKDALAIIFERFRQADGSTTRRAGGTGLGLTITRQLVLLHDGDIWAESQLGVGSAFTFRLPTYETALAAEQAQAEIENAQQDAQLQPETGD